ncbi:prepilin-type N-terminal cleavage/methylation domain-containing protein [Methylobacterium sp. WL12]|uniref:prepilin-type N-terminal cleavage/methylation domain-containing protein n=1 Tax=Methylobacterium sp. WL12 TaxID=2603890 RepID=UPI0011CC9ECF|nr:prepilin-type N-terminal cleavage/methylation domain-containing protein [Methylobacterium sp. WL12]TXM72379.1 prepilin-type N-terminal cleavage/methylation domain-containing protein [Methylobacterium sp. WL12]
MNEARPEAGQAGFTLVEVVVCLALASLIGLLLVQTLQIASRASGVAGRVAAAEEVQSVRDHLRRTLGSLVRRRTDGRRPFFLGRPDGLAAVIAPDAAAERPAETQVTLAGTPRTDLRLDLVERRRLAEPGAEVGAGDEEVLLAGVTGLSFRYFGVPTGNAPAVWLAQWTRPDRAPKLVEIRIAFDPSDRRRWPPFLVALGDRP